jgi:hypothetical protein
MTAKAAQDMSIKQNYLGDLLVAQYAPIYILPENK